MSSRLSYQFISIKVECEGRVCWCCMDWLLVSLLVSNTAKSNARWTWYSLALMASLHILADWMRTKILARWRQTLCQLMKQLGSLASETKLIFLELFVSNPLHQTKRSEALVSSSWWKVSDAQLCQMRGMCCSYSCRVQNTLTACFYNWCWTKVYPWQCFNLVF